MKTPLILGLCLTASWLGLQGAEATPEKPMADGEMKKPMMAGTEMKKPMAEMAEAEKKPMTMTETTEMPAKKKMEEKTEDTAPKEDNSTTITPFRSPHLPTAKETRTFQLSKLNKPLAYETSAELKKLFSIFITQNLWEADSNKFAKTPGCIAQVSYAVLQDLGDNRYVVKGNWTGVGGNDVLPAGNDAWAVLLLDHPASLGDTGKIVGINVGTVALTFTAKFPPIKDKKITLRREAFLQCKPLEDSPANLQQFIDQVNQGAELSVVSTEKVVCKTCTGLGFTREPQKGKLEDKRIPCTDCENGRITKPIETKFVP